MGVNDRPTPGYASSFARNGQEQRPGAGGGDIRTGTHHFLALART